jgi:hypothetical protein
MVGSIANPAAVLAAARAKDLAKLHLPNPGKPGYEGGAR